MLDLTAVNSEGGVRIRSILCQIPNVGLKKRHSFLILFHSQTTLGRSLVVRGEGKKENYYRGGDAHQL